MTKISIVLLFILVLLPCVTVIVPDAIRDMIKLVIIVFPILAGLQVNSIRKRIMWMVSFVFIFHTMFWFAHWQFFIGTFIGYMRVSFFFWAPLFMACVLLALKENNKPLFDFYVVLICITTVTTIIGCIVYPESSRILSTGTGYGYLSLKKMYNALNIGSYNFVYGMEISLPMFYYKAKTTKKFKLFYNFIIIIGLIVAVVTQYTTAILMFAVFLVFIFSTRSKSPGKTFLIYAFILILFLIFKSSISDVFQNLGYKFQESGSETVAKRMLSVSRMISGEKLVEGNDYDALARQSLYLASFETFTKYPIIGIWSRAGEFASDLAEYGMVGGHSELLDILASDGLVGGALFACLFGVHIKNIIRSKKNELLNKCSLVSVLLFFVLASINTVFTSDNIGISVFLLPALLYQENNKSNSVSMRIDRDVKRNSFY